MTTRPCGTLILAIGTNAIFACGVSSAAADPILSFKRISPPDANASSLHPSMNNQGRVAFSIPVDVGGTLRRGVFTGTGGPLTKVVSPADGVFDFAIAPGISDSGQVAFFGRTADGVGSTTGIFRKDGMNPAVLIAEVSPAAGATGVFASQFSCDSSCSIANDGRVIFSGYRQPSGTVGIYVGTGGPPTPLFEAPNSAFGVQQGGAINGAGLGAFIFEHDVDETLATASPLTGFVGTKGIFKDLSTLSYSINDHGSMTFAATLDDGREGVFQVNTLGNISTVVDSSSYFKQFATFGSNNLGGVAGNNVGGTAFLAELDQGGGVGIYRGPDPVLHRLVAKGDVLFGKTVDRLFLGRDALNDSGKVAFSVAFTDGSSAIARADPLIELASVDLSSLDPTAQLTTGSGTGVGMSQAVNTPIDLFDLSFDLEFLAGRGELTVVLGTHTLGKFGPSDAGAITFGSINPHLLFASPNGLLPEVTLQFLFSGPAGSTLKIDDVLMPGLFNGRFDIGYFDGWSFDTSRGGAAIVSAFDLQSVPEPVTAALIGTGVSFLALRRLRRGG